MKNDLDNNRLVAEQVTTGDQGAENVEPRFTPGPWNIISVAVGSKSGASKFAAQMIDATMKTTKNWLVIDSNDRQDDGATICPAVIGFDTPRAIANAHLISAAPDLLRACEDCMENRGDWGSLMADAIRKARGETQ